MNSDNTSVGRLSTTPVGSKDGKQELATTLEAVIRVNKERMATAQITKPKVQVGAERTHVSATFCHKVIKALAEIKAELAKVKKDVRTLKEMHIVTQKHLRSYNRVGDYSSRLLPNGETAMKNTVSPIVSGVRKEPWNGNELEEKCWKGTPLPRDLQLANEETHTDLHSPSRRSLSTQGQPGTPTLVRPRSPSPTFSDIDSPERNYCSLDVVKNLSMEEDGNLLTRSCDELISNLMNGPMVRANDVHALQVFADEIWACIHRLDSTGMLEAVETKCFLLKVTKRFCGGLQQDYDDRANQFEKSSGSYPGIRWLADFVLEVLRRANAPVTGGKPEISVPERVQTQVSPQKAEQSPPPQERCPICPGDHTLNACPKFRMMLIQDRIAVVKTLEYCYLCLKGKHIASDCKVRVMCGINQCQGRHSYLLHLHRRDEITSVATSEDKRRFLLSTHSGSKHCNEERNTPIRVKRESSPEKRGEPQQSHRDTKRARSRESREEKKDSTGLSRSRQPWRKTDDHDKSRRNHTDISKQT